MLRGGTHSMWRVNTTYGSRFSVSLDDQDRAYAEAMEDAYETYDDSDSPLALARRRLVTSRVVMIVLAVIAVVLTVGGIAGPQIVYAREASRFDDLAAQANAAADEAEQLDTLVVAEQLLLELRSKEAEAAVEKMHALSKRASTAIAPEFKKQIGETANELSAALDLDTEIEDADELSAVAIASRQAQQPDPRSWFDVNADQLVSLADIQVADTPRIETEGTVTLERVHEMRQLLSGNEARVDELESAVSKASGKNAKIQAVISRAVTDVTAEMERAAQVTLANIKARDLADPALSEADLALAKKLESAANAMRQSVAAETFAVDPSGKIVGFAPGVPLTEGALRIPGGDAIRLKFVVPKLLAYLDAFREDRLAREAANEAASEEEAARLAAEQSAGGSWITQPEAPGVPTTPPVGPTTPPVTPTDPPIEPTDPPVEPTDPPIDPVIPPEGVL